MTEPEGPPNTSKRFATYYYYTPEIYSLELETVFTLDKCKYLLLDFKSILLFYVLLLSKKLYSFNLQYPIRSQSQTICAMSLIHHKPMGICYLPFTLLLIWIELLKGGIYLLYIETKRT